MFFKIFIRLPKLEHVGQSTGVASVVVDVVVVRVEVVVLLVVVAGLVVVVEVVVIVVVVVVVVVVDVVVVEVDVVVRCSVDVVEVLGWMPSPLPRGFFRASVPWNIPKAKISVLNLISVYNEVVFFAYRSFQSRCALWNVKFKSI